MYISILEAHFVYPAVTLKCWYVSLHYTASYQT